MCGIVGGKNLTELQVKKYWGKLAHRGTDSYGAILFNQNITTVKNLYKKNIKLPQSNFILAHNRWASVGGVNIDLAHPIVKNNVAIIHNGTKKSIKEVFSKNVESDTQGILKFALNLNNLNTLANIINGAGVIFIVDLKNGRVFFHRDETRPLMINKDRTLIASEPVEGGEWALIKEQDKLYNSFEEFLQNAETYNFVNCDNIELKSSSYHYNYMSNFNIYEKCVSCKKTHFLHENGQCPACKSKGIKIPKQHTYTHTQVNHTTTKKSKIPINALVHLNNNPNIYRVVSETNGMYHLMRIDNSKIVYYQPSKIIAPVNPKYLIKDQTYLFTDKEEVKPVKGVYLEATQNENYKYRVRIHTYTTMYKYVLWEKDIKLNLN